MKLYFAAAAIALFSAAPSFAQSVMETGQPVREDCFRAAKAAQVLSERGVRLGIAACNAALTGDLAQQARAGTLTNRGTLQAAAHNDDVAIADFNAALARDPNLAPAYIGRGLAAMRAARYDDARADFTRAIDLAPADLHVGYFYRGEAQEASGNLVAAYHDYRKAQELSPDFKPASIELARFQVTQRQVADIR
ncbi:MAG TPA: tetratricopeptide repeat protein [Rhizomicrobium sp.]|nr:tetratricopeptide repeat protein [Rhizomicrobium sp.]